MDNKRTHPYCFRYNLKRYDKMMARKKRGKWSKIVNQQKKKTNEIVCEDR